MNLNTSQIMAGKIFSLFLSTIINRIKYLGSRIPKQCLRATQNQVADAEANY